MATLCSFLSQLHFFLYVLVHEVVIVLAGQDKVAKDECQEQSDVRQVQAHADKLELREGCCDSRIIFASNEAAEAKKAASFPMMLHS